MLSTYRNMCGRQSCKSYGVFNILQFYDGSYSTHTQSGRSVINGVRLATISCHNCVIALRLLHSHCTYQIN